jgi:hypothetical protein
MRGAHRVSSDWSGKRAANALLFSGPYNDNDITGNKRIWDALDLMCSKHTTAACPLSLNGTPKPSQIKPIIVWFLCAEFCIEPTVSQNLPFEVMIGFFSPLFFGGGGAKCFVPPLLNKFRKTSHHMKIKR